MAQQGNDPVDAAACRIAPPDLSGVTVAEIRPAAPLPDYLAAMLLAEGEAKSRLGEAMLLSWYGHLAGSFLISALILFIFYKDIRRYKPVYLKNYKVLLLLGVLITGTLILCRTFGHLFPSGLHRGLDFPGDNTFIFGIPVPLGAMLATLIFDFHTAIIISFALSLLTGVWLNNPFFPIYAFVGSLTAAFSVMRCRKRSGLVKGGIYVSGVNLLTTAIILLMSGDLLAPSAPSAFFFATFSGIVVASAVSLLLPAIEYAFRFTR